ncbi:sensor histidine kinase [Opitutus terrae]|uniref:Histidine kinase n=1 Tax=Opitutus terrae (strain DSM 11246 / JCM 15787 / PB90-1) TaxID=452637 RepID=B1ZY62_OPITP|nr:sensor histidine kinase [Opitutus terrae]ACB76208.1 histidine kinase [Opitutus terrae PB90-1]
MINAPGFRHSIRHARWLSVLLTLVAAGQSVTAIATETVLTTAAQVRALTEEEARHAVPVRLQGVFMGEADPEGIAFVIQDQTEGIYVQGPAELVAGLVRGDLLQIEGVTDPGGFAPYVVARNITKTGQGPIPEPARVSLEELSSGQMDAKWIEVSGIVRSVDPKLPSDVARPPPGTRYAVPSSAGVSASSEGKVKFKLASGGARLVVQVCGEFNPEDYIDAEVRLRGLCFNLHNRNRQFVRPFVQVPRGVEVIREKPPPERPFDGEPYPVGNLLRFEQLTGQQGHRVHVRGIVLHHQPGYALWIRDRDHSLRIDTTQAHELRPGDEVDVVGFPALRDYSAELEDGIYRKRGTQAPPAPHVLTDVSSALRQDGDLVQLDARLAELRRFPDSVALVLDWHDTAIRAQLRLPEHTTAPTGWLPGSLVRVSGVCSVVTDEAGPLGGLWEPRSFQLLLRSAADLAVVQPPSWWNAERVVWILSGSLVLAVAAVAAVVFASRRRLHEQERRRAMAETEFAAILNERNRVAREIHDTLSQGLGAISVQLELARTHAGEMSAPVRDHLGLAHKLARAALADARDSIWNMRSQVLERCDLGEALNEILTQTTEGTRVQPGMQVEGLSRRLPPVVENNLLRIGQEAITNASKHAHPTRIDVRLAFDGRTVRLTVEDDGVGFVNGTQPKGSRSFGLVGMKERAQLLGGTVQITSAPGQGTRVTVVVTV